jgi:preprotein translocase subunit SecY
MMTRSPGGEKKVKKITIILGIFVAIISSLLTTKTMNNYYSILTNESWYVYAIIAILHACGTAVAVWIGETITEKGFGNGQSLLVCINVLSSVPTTISSIKNSGISVAPLLTMILFATIVVLLTVVAETSERKIPLFYPKAAARGQISRDNMFYPIKLNLSGVMPIIFASYVVQFASLLGKMDNKLGKIMKNVFDSGTVHYIIIYAVLIFVFTYIYTIISFNPKEISENLQKNGAVIPSVRPGKDTTEYIEQVRESITTQGAIYLTIIYFVPTLILTLLDVNYIATTSIMILVGVSIETCKALKVEIQLRDYKTL